MGASESGHHPNRVFIDQDGDLHLNGGKVYVGGVQSVAAGSSLTLTVDEHSGKTILLDTAAGSTVTLPAATGSGTVFRFRVSVLATSNDHIVQAASADDAMQGYLLLMDDTSDNAVAFFAVSGTSDTITLNRSTKGSVTLGEYFELEDVAEGLWHVRGVLSCTGTPASPFSADVS